MKRLAEPFKMLYRTFPSKTERSTAVTIATIHIETIAIWEYGTNTCYLYSEILYPDILALN